MQKKFLKNKKDGYTIIETMVAISVFLIVITIGMGALLNTSSLHNKSSNMRSIMDSLSFMMDDMSKNLRTGYNYHCGNVSGPNYLALNCKDGKMIVFESSSGNPTDSTDQWLYYMISGKILKSTKISDPDTWVQLNPNEIIIDLDKSGFFVFGADESQSDGKQPFVVIRLSGTINYKGVGTPFSLQTSVSQRQRDVSTP